MVMVVMMMVVVMMVMVVIMLVIIVLIMFVMVVMMLMLFIFMVMLVVMFIVVIIVVIIVIIMFLGFSFSLYLLYPSGGSSHRVPVKLVCIDNLVKVYVTKVALENFRLGLECAYDVFELVQFGRLHLCCLVEQDDVAEFYLLDNERCKVFLVDVVLHQVIAPAKLVLHAQSVHYGNDAVEAQYTVLDVFGPQGRYGADSLRNRCRFADAACLDDNVVELLHVNYLFELLHQVHLQRAADTSVLQGNERVVFLAHYTTFLYKVCIDVHLTYVVDDDGKLDAFLVGQDFVEQCCLATSQIACQ